MSVLPLLSCLVAPAAAETVRDAFPPPAGFTRAEPGAFAAFVQKMEVEPANVPVRTHDGKRVAHEARVITLPLARGDLQQCADSVIRVRAEWERAQGKPVSFHATSGDAMPWSRFEAGETPYAEGNRLKWRQGSTKQWDDYLRLVFTWAGTWSLEAFDTVAATGAPKPGDLLLQGGFPGHTVLVVDVATQGDETRLLVAEGFMPAQSFHVEKGPHEGWFAWTADGLELPHWRFATKDLRRFRE